MPEREKTAIDDFVRITEPDATDPEYQAWKKASIEAAIKHADEHPDDFLTIEDAWKWFGLEG